MGDLFLASAILDRLLHPLQYHQHQRRALPAPREAQSGGGSNQKSRPKRVWTDNRRRKRREDRRSQGGPISWAPCSRPCLTGRGNFRGSWTGGGGQVRANLSTSRTTSTRNEASLACRPTQCEPGHSLTPPCNQSHESRTYDGERYVMGVSCCVLRIAREVEGILGESYGTQFVS